MSDSCLSRRLTRYITLTEKETSYLDSLEEGEQVLVAGQSLDELIDGHLCVLSSGWAVSEFMTAQGRTITRIFLPGEILGLAELGSGKAAEHSTRMQTEGKACTFRKDRIGDLFETLPRLAALITALSGLDQMTLRDRLGYVATAPAEERMTHFLLDLRARLAVANVGSGNRFRIPFTQVEIGTAIGVTSVTVNKVLQKLRRDGVIEMDRPYIRILDREALETRIAFVDRYASIDTSWFPDQR